MKYLRYFFVSTAVIVGLTLTHCYEVPPINIPISSGSVACSDHITCASGVCHMGFIYASTQGVQVPHRCVPEDAVKYVDRDMCDTTKQDRIHQGTRQDPFCQVSTAVGQGTFVSVKPTTISNGYDPVFVQTGQVVMIVGTNRTSAPVIQGVQVKDPNTEAYLDGISLSTRTDLRSMPAGVGLTCSSQATVSLIRSVVSANTTGIEASFCKMARVEKTYIGNNGNVGMVLGGTSGYRVANSIIVQNGGVGVRVGSSNGEFVFTTIANNGTDARVPEAQTGGALQCLPDADLSGTHPAIIRNSIVVGNQMSVTSPMPTQLQGTTCALDHAVVSPRDSLVSVHPSSQAIFKTEVVFLKKGTEWTLDPSVRSWDPSLVIDRGQTKATDPSYDDYFGNPRPRPEGQRGPGGTGYDIGHHQT